MHKFNKPNVVFSIKAAVAFLLSMDLHDYRQTVLLAGSGRSGTTWFGDIINYDGSYRVMFEPFRTQKVDVIRHWKHHQYIRPDNRDKTYFEPAKAILSGNIKRTLWVDMFNKKLFARKRLIKGTRVSLMLKWIKTNFPEIPIILLLRHPCAVALSKQKLGWEAHIEDFLAQQELVEDFLHPFISAIENATSDFERYVFAWCIENYVPLKQFSPGEIHPVFYENLCTNPEQEIKKLFSFLHKEYKTETLDAAENPSALARKGESAIFTGESLVESWKRQVTDEQIQRAIEILSMFGLQKIYAEDPMPLISNGSFQSWFYQEESMGDEAEANAIDGEASSVYTDLFK